MRRLLNRSAARRSTRTEARRRIPAQFVIASVAKQSRLPPRRDAGLLRCARNDGGAAQPFFAGLLGVGLNSFLMSFNPSDSRGHSQENEPLVQGVPFGRGRASPM